MSPATDRRQRNQGGFALALTLGIILMTALTLSALFGLMSLTVKTTKASEVTAREGRAADAAVEAAIVQIRHDPDACERSSQTVLTDKIFDQGTPDLDDDVTVSVECEPIGGSAGSTDQVRIVGKDGYQGGVKWKADCAGAAQVPSCTPWTLLMGASPTGLAGSKPGLVHTGPESLRFASGVTVRTGAAALGSAPDGDLPPKPALTVTGQYVQGAPGLKLAAGDDLGPTRCGIFGAVEGSAAIIDGDNQPTCDDDGAKAVATDPTDSEADSGLVASTVKPGIPSSCPPGSVMTFQPGTYDAGMVTALNGLIDGSRAGCRNKTFWFSPGAGPAPGIYSFDGPSLNFADAGSTYVFGAPLDWDPASGAVPAEVLSDPAAPLCDEAMSGSSVVLSARTAIKHTAGRLSICPSFGPGDKPFPALYQTTSVPNHVTLAVKTGAELPRTLGFTCNIWTDPIDLSTGACTAARNLDFVISSQGTRPLKSLKVLLTGTEGNETQNNFIEGRSVNFFVRSSSDTHICHTGAVNGTPNGGFTLSYEVMAGECANKLKDYTPAMLNGLTLRTTTSFRLKAILPLVYASQGLSITGAEAQVNALPGTVDTSKASSPSGAWKNPANVGEADKNLAEPNMGSCSELVCVKKLATPTDSPAMKDHTRGFDMLIEGGFSFAGLDQFTASDVDPRIDSLRVDVDLATAQKPFPLIPLIPEILKLDARYFRADLNARIEIETPSGTRCVAHDGGVNGGSPNEIQRVSFSINTIDDLEDGGSCNHSIRTFEELTDPATKLNLVIEMPCMRSLNSATPWLCHQGILNGLILKDQVWEVRPPSIDRIAISATTDSYVGAPANSEIAIDAAAAAPRKMFRALGRAWLPLTDLDIHWLGDGGTAALFNSELVLHGLGSDMVPGATTAYVCCGRPDSREVRLRAKIEGKSRLLATIEYVDIAVTVNPDGSQTAAYEPGTDVNVIDWRRGRLVKD